MGLFDIVGKLAEVPFRIAQVPTKIIREVDEHTIDSGVGEALDEVNEASLGEIGRTIREGLEEMER